MYYVPLCCQQCLWFCLFCFDFVGVDARCAHGPALGSGHGRVSACTPELAHLMKLFQQSCCVMMPLLLRLAAQHAVLWAYVQVYCVVCRAFAYFQLHSPSLHGLPLIRTAQFLFMTSWFTDSSYINVTSNTLWVAQGHGASSTTWPSMLICTHIPVVTYMQAFIVSF